MSALQAMDAMNAYAAALGNKGAVAGGAGQSAKTALAGAASFESVLKDAVNSVVETARKSESASVSGLNGDMNLVDVVTAVSNAEMMIETVVTVRDKVIQSYQEILRMPI